VTSPVGVSSSFHWSPHLRGAIPSTGSVIYEEDTTRGAEVFPVVHVDGGIRSHAHDASSEFRNLLLDTGVGIHDDEDALPVIVTNKDFEVVVDVEIVGDVVHACMILRKCHRVNPTVCDCREIPKEISRADSRSCRTHDPPRDRNTSVRRSP